MNPWEVVRREIAGATRSMRYDLATRRLRRVLAAKTRELPVVAGPRKHRAVVVAGLAAAAGVGGYLVVTGGVESLLAGGHDPASLTPSKRVRPSASAEPELVPSPRAGAKMPVTLPSPRPSRTSLISPTPTRTPPVPTPAPTCPCVTPSATTSPSGSASPSPSPSLTWPTIAPTSTATR